MSRAPRQFIPGGIYHLNAHGLDDRPIFMDDADRKSFALRLRRVALREGWRLYAVCLMDTHFHLVLQPIRDVSNGMRVLNGAHWPWSTYPGCALRSLLSACLKGV